MARKALLDTTIKKLFALSGNYCAFPDCPQKMVENNSVIGVICHIEAAEEGGERYNPNQSDDDRRDFPNLILLCPTHHTITNNVVDYPVQRLIEIKATHEAEYVETPYAVSDEAVSRVIALYAPTQSIQNAPAGTQNITQSGDILNLGVDAKDVAILLESVSKGNLMLQEYFQAATAKTTTEIIQFTTVQKICPRPPVSGRYA